MSARSRTRRKRQKEAPRKVGRQSAGPREADTFSGEVQCDDNSGEVNSQFWDQDAGRDAGDDRWDDVVTKYLDAAASRLRDGRELVVHDSGWRRRDGRRMRLVLVEGESVPVQRQWVLDIMKRALWKH